MYCTVIWNCIMGQWPLNTEIKKLQYLTCEGLSYLETKHEKLNTDLKKYISILFKDITCSNKAQYAYNTNKYTCFSICSLP